MKKIKDFVTFFCFLIRFGRVQGLGFSVRFSGFSFLGMIFRVWMFGCDFRGLVIDQG